jgi:hypothetical protein
MRSIVPLCLALSVTLLTSDTSGASSQTVTVKKYGLSFTLPRGWQQIPLTRSDVSGLLDEITKTDPSLKSALTTEVKKAASEGMKVFALGPIVDQFASNINIIVEPLADGPSTSDYYKELGVEVKLNLAETGMKSIHTSKVHWSQGNVLQATYTLHLASSSVTDKGVQDYVWHKGMVFIVTFSSSKLSIDESVAKVVARSWNWN